MSLEIGMTAALDKVQKLANGIKEERNPGRFRNPFLYVCFYYLVQIM